MASYTPITTKEIVDTLSSEDKIIIIQNGQVRQLMASDLVSAINLAKDLKTAGITVGNSDISSIGNGSLTGAIAELKRLIDEMPKITSGTAAPTGGEDGDVYIMHE